VDIRKSEDQGGGEQENRTSGLFESVDDWGKISKIYKFLEFIIDLKIYFEYNNCSDGIDSYQYQKVNTPINGVWFLYRAQKEVIKMV
jgi:hypothetical protein